MKIECGGQFTDDDLPVKLGERRHMKSVDECEDHFVGQIKAKLGKWKWKAILVGLDGWRENPEKMLGYKYYWQKIWGIGI